MVGAERCYLVLIDPAFQRLSLKLWRYRHDPDGPRQMWMAIVDDPGETAGRTFAAGLRLRASVQMVVMVSLGRLGEADYEGSSMRVRLEAGRSEEYTSELQSLMRISYAVFTLKKKTSIPATL